jgi:hypothetical protein
MIMLLFLVVGCGLPLSLAWSFARFRHDWSKRKVVLWSAAPFPMIGAVPCLIVVINAITTPAERCGVDACGMAIAAGLGILGLLAAIFVGWAILAFFTVTFVRRGGSRAPDMDVFK